MADQKQTTRPDDRDVAAGEAERSGEEMLELLRRERADFLNYKRRVERERAEDRARECAEVLQALLPVLDELDRALTQIPEDLEAHPWVQGVALSRGRMTEALRKLGVERIDDEGAPFNPARHEALYYDTRPDAADRRVGTVIRAGYQRGDRVLRPAQVGVVGPAERSEQAATENGGSERPPAAAPRSDDDARAGG